MKSNKNNIIQALSRRSLLAGTALCGLGLALKPALTLAAQASVQTSLVRDNIHLISGAGCNVVVAVGSDSVLVVDGGHEDYSAAVLAEIDRLGQGKPVTALFNTNWRPEHCGLNEHFGSLGTRIIAHENTRLWQSNDFYVSWEDRHYRPMAPTAQANSTFYKQDSLTFAGSSVDYGFISQFHTDGDIYVYFRESNVIVLGDMLTVNAYPLLDYVSGGWIGGAQKTTAELLQMTDAQTLLVPAVGAIQQRPALEVQQQMLDLAYEKVADAYRTGRSLDQFMATSPMSEYDSIYGDASLFVQLLYRGTWYHVPGRAIPGII